MRPTTHASTSSVGTVRYNRQTDRYFDAVRRLHVVWMPRPIGHVREVRCLIAITSSGTSTECSLGNEWTALESCEPNEDAFGSVLKLGVFLFARRALADWHVGNVCTDGTMCVLVAAPSALAVFRLS